MPKSRILLWGIFGFLGGVGIATVWQSYYLLGIGAVACLCVLLIHLPKKCLAFSIGFIFGVSRFLFSIPHFDTHDVAYYRDNSETVTVEGIIMAEVDIRSDRQYVLVRILWLEVSSYRREVSGKLLVKAKRYPEYTYGDRIKIQAKLVSPPTFDTFSYSDLLAKDDIYVVAFNPKIYLLAHGQGEPFWALIFGIKTILSERINILFSEPEAGLVAGLLLGLRRSIPADIMNDFSRAGLTHILAISGYNVSLMVIIFGLIFRSAGRRWRFFGMMGGIIFLVLFTGFSASVIRAALMGGFVLFAILRGRKSNGLLMLFLSAFIMVFFQPRMLTVDLSFQLSFLATLGLILCLPFIEKYTKKLPNFLEENMSVTLAAQVFTTPLILYKFGKFSLIAPVANILFLPFVPIIMFFSFFGMAISYIFPPFALIFNAVAWVLLKIMLAGVHFMANLPGAFVVI